MVNSVIKEFYENFKWAETAGSKVDHGEQRHTTFSSLNIYMRQALLPTSALGIPANRIGLLKQAILQATEKFIINTKHSGFLGSQVSHRILSVYISSVYSDL